MKTVDEILDALAAVDPQKLRSEIEKLRAVQAWARQQIGIDYAIGDRVVIASAKPSEVGGGWHHYREALAPGQSGIARTIEFSAYHKRWLAYVAMDRTWSVGEMAGGRTRRTWNGPVAEMPEGFEPRYDIKAHPEGKIKVFLMNAEWLRRAAPTPPVSTDGCGCDCHAKKPESAS